MRRTGLLEGTRVVDLTKATSGPFATQVLGDLGAEILKVEEPAGSPRERSILDPARVVDGIDAYFMSVNRNKQSVVLELASADGRAALEAMVRTADVVVDNFRPGVARKLGVDHPSLAAIKPDIVTCSLTGFGLDGPLSNRPAYDLTVLAETGMLDFMSRANPSGDLGYPGAPIADLVGGLYCAVAVPAALRRREVTGEGCHIDVSMYDAVLSLYVNYATQLLNFGAANHYHDRAVWGIYHTATDPLAITAHREPQWRAFCRAIGRPELQDDDRFHDAASRTANYEALDELVRAELGRHDAATWGERFDAEGVPYAQVRTVEDALASEQVQVNQMVVEATTATGNPVRLLGSPIGVPGLDAPFEAPPIYGGSTDAVLEELGAPTTPTPGRTDP